MIKKIKRSMKLSLRWLRSFSIMKNGVSFIETPWLSGRILFQLAPGSEIRLGRNVILNSKMSKNTLEARGSVVIKTIQTAAVVTIGDDTGITSSTISASSRIDIGNRVLIGSGCIITDSDHHFVVMKSGDVRRNMGLPEPRQENRIEICDDAFIGARSIILKGVRIGKNAVVGAGSVVTKNVEDNTVVAGNPAKTIGSSLDLN